MRKEEEQEIYNFNLTILSVKMKVKFPCKMALEQTGRSLTNEVPPNEEGRFVFNQEIRLREDSQKLFAELNICLVTQKGARYISGIAKLYHNQLMRSEGDRLVITLSKCLDSEAFCELRVDKVTREGGPRKRTLTNLPERNPKVPSAKHTDEGMPAITDYRSPRKIETPYLGFESRSESYFPVTANIKSSPGQGYQQLRGREAGGTGGAPGAFRKSNVSPKGRSRPINSKNKYIQFNNDFQRQKTLQAQVYKQNYQKLKQKYLKQAETSKSQMNKRMMLQNNENNFKLEIVKLKLKNEELEKALTEKTQRLKQLSMALAAQQGREADINLLKEDLANKEHAIRIMDDTIVSLSKENDQLRLNSKDITYKLEEKLIMLENQLEIVTSHATAKQEQLERELKNLTEQLQHKEIELNRKNDMLEKEKHSVNDLQRALQNKLFQFDSHLQNQRTQCKQKIQQTKNKTQQAQQSLTKAISEKNDLLAEIDKYKGLLLKSQYQLKLYQQQMNTLRTELEQLRPNRDKINDILKELRIVSEQKILLEKAHEKFVVSKENTLDQLTNEYKKQTEAQKKTIKEFQEKNKIMSSKLIETEAQLELTKNSLEKCKKNQESLSKDVAELKEKEKTLKKGLKAKEEECEDGKKQLLRVKQKSQNLLESTKVEFTKAREELTKVRIDLQSEMVKNEQLVQTNSELNMELARMKMAQQFSDQKYQKLMQSAQQKYHQFQRIIKQHEGVIELLEQKIRSQKDNEKDFYGKLQKCDYEITMVVDKNDKIIKQIKTLQQKNKLLEMALKNKQVELVEALKKISQTENKVYNAEDKAKELKDELMFGRNELQKTKKIVEIVQRDYEKAKADIIAYCQKLNESEKQLDDKHSENKRYQENLNDLENKYNLLKKQHDKFKDSVSDALTNSFAQVVQTFAIDKLDTLKTSFGTDISPITIKRGINDISTDLVAAITTAGKDSKAQINKLTERTKSLERDLEMIRNEMQRSEESSRKQLQEKTRYIEQLEDGLRSIKNQKGQADVQNHIQIQDLQIQLKNYQEECHQLASSKNQLQFAIKGLQLQVERISQEHDKKCYLLLKDKQELQEKLEYQYHNTENAEKKVHELEVEMMNLNSVVILEKEQSYKKDLRLAEIQEEKQTSIAEAISLKKKLKESEEKYNQLQIQFVTLKELKQKFQSMLTEQQSKLKQVRAFNNNILKQKQQIIKKDLERNLEITDLQNSLNELKHQLQQCEQTKNKYKSDLEELKQSQKRNLLQTKEIDNSLNQEKNKYNQVRDKLRDKEQLVEELKEEVSSLKKKIEEQQTRTKSMNEEFQAENDMLTQQLETINSQSNEHIRSLETLNSKTGQQLQTAKEEIAELQQALFVERQNNNSMQESINKLKFEQEDLRKKLEEMEKVYEQLAEENREKDQHMFELGGKLYEYENKMREMEEEKQREIEELNNSINLKYDEDYQQITQKIELIQKQKDYFKDKHSQKQQELSKKVQELKHRQIQQLQLKKAFEQKMKKMQQQKLLLFTDKNKQIAKILQQNKTQFQSLRVKDSQLRKITHQLEISRSTILKLENKIKQMQNDRSTQIKAYQAEIENLRKKQMNFKNYKDNIRTNQWNCEREVRKMIQNFIKKILENGDKQPRNETLISSIKGMEEGMLNAISVVVKE